MPISYRTVKIYWNTVKDAQEEVDRYVVGRTRLISIKPSIPDMTTTQNCSELYLEFPC